MSARDTTMQDVTSEVPAHATGVLIIDLDRIAANWRALAALVRPAECGAVVKADAYGLGAHRVIPALAKAGCRTFFVATLDEAKTARALAPDATVYMLDGIVHGAANAVHEAGVIPVVSTLSEIAAWSALSPSRQERQRAALHIDTGLNRLGLAASDIQALVRDVHMLDRLDVTLVMSHLACADEPEAKKNAQQRAIFEQLLPLLPRTARSLAASDGLMLGTDYHYDLVRPGYALYGGQAFGGGPTPVAPAVRLHVKILQVRDVAPGQSVGYSATWSPQRLSRIAIIAAGYADGLFRQLSRASGGDGGFVAINGQLTPIVGRVSMDLITVDVSDIVPTPQPGDLVEVIGPNISIEAVGAGAGTIGYEVLTSLGRRFHRIYQGGEC
ncbi:MAG TPA: alanine racemase [Hyphomicrobiaceae bacterium]|nr:alanine racemase [Hyphomicrobiaceae bacterium]